jgi:hypothetical protein
MIMGPFHIHTKVAGLILVTATIHFSLTAVFASEPGDKKAGSALSVVPAEKGGAAPVKGEDPKAKESADTGKMKVGKNRKGAGHKSANRTREAEPLPGARLNIKQVMQVLKTTRDFSGKNLSGLRLVGFDFSRCRFKGADLSNANLERALLEEAILELADLSGANMKMTDLRVTGLKGARMDRAILDGAIGQDGIICAKNSIGFCREQSDRFGSE